MALVVNDRVKETSTTTGTGTLSLAGAVTGFETFVAGIGNSNTTYYSIVNENGEFEVGLGTVTDATPDTLARTTVISSSNSDSAVNFSAGTKDVFCTLPASKAVIKDASGNIVANNGSALTNLNASNLASGTVPNARLDAQLQDVAGLSTTSGKIIQGDGSNFGLSAYTLPTSDGSSSQVLTTDGSGAVTFQTPTVGDITSVVAGSGLTGGATSGAATLNVGAGTGVTVNADDIAIGQSVATSASPTFAGLTTTANVNFGDNDKAIFGAGSDLQLYHDGSNSYVTDQGAGDLIMGGSSLIKISNAAFSEDMAVFNNNGSVDLYHNNSKKFETTSSGVQTTGTVNVNGAYTLPTSDGSANQVLTTDGSGALTFETPTTGDITSVVAGSGLTGGATSGAATLNVGAGNLIDVQADQIDVDLSELTTSTSNGDGDFFAVVDASNAQKKLTKGNINISGFNNDSGFTTNTGTVTSVGITPGTGLDAGSAVTTSGTISVDLDLSELTDMTATMTGSDEFIVLDSSAERRKAASEIGLSIFNNDAGFTTNTGDITSVVAGSGLTGGATSGAATLNVGAGTGIDVAADAISVDVSDFMSNGSNNRVVTATGADGMNAEANMQFDGSTLTVTGDIVPGANDSHDLGASDNVWRNLYTGDLHLSNESKSEGNAVDGTKGSWTIQEGAEDLYLFNNKSGKKYKFKLEEV